MAEVIKIVLTGGPCGGKTTALNFLKDELEKLNIKVFILEEIASNLLSNGITPQKLGVYEFHKQLFETQLKEEMLSKRKLRHTMGKRL